MVQDRQVRKLYMLKTREETLETAAMPPWPISSMILYFPATRLSLNMRGRGLASVFVRESERRASSASGAVQFRQIRDVSLFSE